MAQEFIVNTLDWSKSPLIPAIVQDFQTKEVLMLGFMNKEALELTLQTKELHYFSRSKNRIWKKGETSGHIQKLHDCFIDCDNDSLLFVVEQIGVACHTGSKSCFFKKIDYKEQNLDSSALESKAHNLNDVYGVIDTLYHTLLERKQASCSTSYTAQLYAKGENAIGKKIIEEAGEVALALKDKNPHEIVYESADLLYHTLVALAFCNIHPNQVEQEIARRFDLSGLEEKARRK